MNGAYNRDAVYMKNKTRNRKLKNYKGYQPVVVNVQRYIMFLSHFLFGRCNTNAHLKTRIYNYKNSYSLNHSFIPNEIFNEGKSITLGI